MNIMFLGLLVFSRKMLEKGVFQCVSFVDMMQGGPALGSQPRERGLSVCLFC